LDGVNSEKSSALSNTNITEDSNLDKSTNLTNKDSLYVAGQTPIYSQDNIENMGLAVFSGAKLVGELNGFESIMHLIVSNDLNTCNIHIPNPIQDTDNLDVYLTLKKKTKNSVDFVNGTPLVSSKIYVNIQIDSSSQASTNSDKNYYSAENTKLIEEACNSYLEKCIKDYLYKTSKDFNADIDGFGRYAVKYFSTMQEWSDYNWLNRFKDATFDVKVETTLESGNTFL